MKIIFDSKYYSTKELSKMLGLTIHAVRKYWRQKKFEGIKIGRGYYASEKSIKTFLNKNKI